MKIGKTFDIFFTYIGRCYATPSGVHQHVLFLISDSQNRKIMNYVTITTHCARLALRFHNPLLIIFVINKLIDSYVYCMQD